MLGVRIPKIETSSPNLTVKIDDVDFKATNRGVWCMHFHEVTDSNRFTDWQDYESDYVLDTVAQQKGAAIIASLENVVEPRSNKVVLEVSETLVTEQLNQPELGIDTTPTTSLKQDETVVQEVVNAITKTPEDAAEAYAAGATTDPLGTEASKKPKSKK